MKSVQMLGRRSGGFISRSGIQLTLAVLFLCLITSVFLYFLKSSHEANLGQGNPAILNPAAINPGHPAGPRNVAGPPTGPRDLVVFIAKDKPRLYRLVGREPVPHGTAQFYNPISLVADPGRKCFYVLDLPKLVSGNRKIWRIAADGTAAIAFQAPDTLRGGPFSRPTSLGLGRDGRVLVSDAGTGLWALETNGHLQRLFDGSKKPLMKITAAAAAPTGGLVVGTSYMHEIGGGQMLETGDQRFRGKGWSASPSHANMPFNRFDPYEAGNSTGRQVRIRVWKNQGGVYQVDVSAQPPTVTGIIPNIKPGGAEHETFWRDLSQLLLDSKGRLVLVDSGSRKTFTDETSDTTHFRSSTSIINGGIFVRHADGRLEDLTFKTPDRGSGPLHRPAGIAQWSADTYIVADPELHIPGINGTGGLLLLNLDGTREARWPFGYRLKPRGVAILRDAGPPAQAAPVRRLTLQDLAGNRTAGAIARIDNVSWEKQTGGYPAGHPLYGLGKSWTPEPRPRAAAHLRSLFEGARWTIAADGALLFCAKGVNPGEQGNPLVMRGQVTANAHLTNALARYKIKNLFDTQVGSLEAVLSSAAPGSITAKVTITVFKKDERLKADFTQPLR